MRKYNGHLHRKYTFQNEEKYKMWIERRDTHIFTWSKNAETHKNNIVHCTTYQNLFSSQAKLSIYLWSSQIYKVLGKLTKSQIRWQWAPHASWTWTQSSHIEWGWSKRSYWPVDLVFIFFARLTNLAHHYVIYTYLATQFKFSEKDWTLSQPASQPQGGWDWEPPN